MREANPEALLFLKNKFPESADELERLELARKKEIQNMWDRLMRECVNRRAFGFYSIGDGK